MLQNNSKNISSKNLYERGNVFLFVLLGVALFAALAITISRGMRSTTTNTMSSKDAELAATDIISFSQKIERAVNRLRRNGISENDISFNNTVVSGYSHGQPDANKIFNPSGSNLSWVAAPSGANDGSNWIFTGSTCITGLGTGSSGCGSDSTSNEELLIVLPNVDNTVCSSINTKLNISGIPADSGNGYSSTKFTGSFADGSEIDLGQTYNAACFSRSGNNHFYSVLISR